jgi:hypothetical protein
LRSWRRIEGYAGGAYMPIGAAGTTRRTPSAGVLGRPMQPFLFFFSYTFSAFSFLFFSFKKFEHFKF